MRKFNCFLCDAEFSELQDNVVVVAKHHIALLDWKPIRPGHLLIAPRNHIGDPFALAPDIYQEIMTAIPLYATALRHCFSKRVAMFISGNEVPEHCHFHLLPLDTGIMAVFNDLSKQVRVNADPQELKVLADRLRSKLNNA